MAPDTRRRSITLDAAWSDGLEGPRYVHGTAADLHGRGSRSAAAARVDAVVDTGGSIRAFSVDGTEVAALSGCSATRGFRDRAAAAFPGPHRERGPLWTLLDDVPAVTSIANYARLVNGFDPAWVSEGRPPRAEVCAGWRSDGTLIQQSLARGEQLYTLGPPAPPLVEVPERSSPLGLRRHRRLDVTPGEALSIDAMFRDTYTDPAGNERVVHEYSLTAEVEPGAWVVVGAEIQPHVLPYIECPAAVASAGLIVGRSLRGLREELKPLLAGPGGCTHLTDLLRSLEDTVALVG